LAAPIIDLNITGVMNARVPRGCSLPSVVRFVRQPGSSASAASGQNPGAALEILTASSIAGPDPRVWLEKFFLRVLQGTKAYIKPAPENRRLLR